MSRTPRPVEPTDSDHERQLGRVALWLDADDLRWLSRHCSCHDDTGDVECARCGRLRFRAMAALHKVGVDEPVS